jgi:outer membrane protein TolC
MQIALSNFAFAQPQSIEPVRPQGTFWTRPYRAAQIPDIRLSNSSRLAGLIRGGTLYLSAQDAIALALDNNVDVELARYQAPLLEWRQERAEAGGALPGIQSGANLAASTTSGQGVLGSQQAAGVSGGGQGTGTRTSGNATVSQIGPVTQNLDPIFQESNAFSHRTVPLANSSQSVISILVQNSRNFSGSLQQGLITGGSVSVSYRDSYLNENAPSDLLNPSVAHNLNFSIQHPLLQGFGAAVNARNITIARRNVQMNDASFRLTLINTVDGVLNSYWSLVGDYEDLKAKRSALETAQKFLEENRRREELGVLAHLDVISAESQVATSQQAVVTSNVTLQQDEATLRSLISRTGGNDPLLKGVAIMPTDHIVVPESETLPPVRELVDRALASRADLELDKEGIENSKISALGSQSQILPALTAFAAESQSGLAGTARIVQGQAPDPYFVGGTGTAMAQVFRRNFPSENVGAQVRALIHNRQAQGDLGIDRLQLRQQELAAARNRNQVQVDVMNAIISVQQATGRYQTALQNRILEEKLLDAEQKKFQAGESTSFNVIQQQRDLSTAQAQETAALVGYQQAHIGLDQAVGSTLETNKIVLSEHR